MAIRAIRRVRKSKSETWQIHDEYKQFCQQAGIRAVALRAFRDLLNELDLYAFLRTRIFSKGRYGRTREVMIELPAELVNNTYDTILLSFHLR